MSLNRLALRAVCLLLAVVWAGAAQAQGTYLLGGSSGGQIQIGGGLPLPIQLTDANGDMIPDWGAQGTMVLPAGSTPVAVSPPNSANLAGPGPGVFPPLLIPRAPGATVMTMTAGAKLTIPSNVLLKPAVQNTLGQFNNNPALYAVASNATYRWPAAPVVLSARNTTTLAGVGSIMTPLPTAGAVGPPTVLRGTTAGGGNIRYWNPGKTKFFGGAAQIAITPMTGTPPPALPVACPGGPAGPPCGPLKASIGFTIFAIGPNAPPPCAGGGCNAIIAAARPNGPQAVGGPIGTVVSTPATPPPGPHVYNIVAGATPKGTISAVNVGVATLPTPPTNMATSAGWPWTTGRVTVTNVGAGGPPFERFIMSGADLRTPGGKGIIQLVSGALSTRPPPAAGGSGPNANRGWIRLELTHGALVPSVSDWGLVLLSSVLLGIGLLLGIRRSRRMEVGA